ncbi:amidohydrolase [Schumannella soli]|uniref:Amidohydrolase family protein n=1 Tax=Schumannella soli TaxID=2590779 RepID=A0A506XX05_9MICO|nr:amidohydrolase [Schumannella soli]TPW74163.1 amidohydrolase family protein [Schumannella soli]
MTTTLYTNARVFTGDDGAGSDAGATPAGATPAGAGAGIDGAAGAVLVDGAEIAWVGAASDAPAANRTVDLDGRLLMPGFTDAHVHLVMMGTAIAQVNLDDARSLPEIQQRLRAARAADPDATILRGRGWLFDAVPDGRPTAAMIDEVVGHVPVFLDANDYHSCWVNRAALEVLGITRDTPDPHGGEIVRDAAGDATGLLLETAGTLHARTYLDAITTDADRDAAAERAIESYLAAGVTGVVDMMLDEYDLAALQRAAERRGGELPIRVSGHWLIENRGDDAANLAQVARAAELAAASASSWLRVIGIKLVLDGVIDACTAAMRNPYSDGSNAGPIWPLEQLAPVVVAADAAGLQIAQHAIGDRASDIALDALERAIDVNGDRPRRHRIEHLEYAAPETPARMARLGVTASMQPVHSDPAIFANWAAMLGDERVERAFPWPEYEDAGALLAFGTDAPTAPYAALANMYVATTRASALDRAVPATHPQFALPLERALGHATRDAAASIGDGSWRGRIAPGFAADLIVLDRDPFVEGPDSLLEARVVETIVAGRTRYRAE